MDEQRLSDLGTALTAGHALITQYLDVWRAFQATLRTPVQLCSLNPATQAARQVKRRQLQEQGAVLSEQFRTAHRAYQAMHLPVQSGR